MSQFEDEDVRQAAASEDAAETVANLPIWRPVAAESTVGPEYDGGDSGDLVETVPLNAVPDFVQPMYSPDTATSYAAMNPQSTPARSNTGLIIAVVALVVALIIAGVFVGISNGIFHGAPKPGGSSGGPSSQTVGSPSSASYAYGFQKTWTVKAVDLGIKQSDLPSGVSLSDVYVFSVAQTQSTWLAQAYWTGTSGGFGFFGVDAATGARKWGSLTETNGAWAACDRHTIGNNFYCYGQKGAYAVDADTGKATVIVTGDLTNGGIAVLGDYLLATNWSPTIVGKPGISLLKPDGQVIWTSVPLELNGYMDTVPDNVLTGGIVVVNDSIGAYVLDVKTGAVLAGASGNVGVVDAGRLWVYHGVATTNGFTSSDGAHWTIDGANNQGWIMTTTPATAPPLSVEPQMGSFKISWVEPNGSYRWSISLPKPIHNLWSTGFSATFDGQHLLVTNQGGETWALSPQDGTILWRNSIGTNGLVGTGFLNPVLLGDGTVLIPRGDRTFALSGSTGEAYWSTSDMWLSAASGDHSTAAIAGQTVYALAPGALYRIEPAMPPAKASDESVGSGNFAQPPSDMPDCSSVPWWYGGPDQIVAAYGKWNDWADGVNSLLICQAAVGFGIARGGAWASDYLSFSQVIEEPNGVFQVTFSGGDLGGVTVSLSPDGTYQVTGGSTGFLGATSGPKPLFEGYFPRGVSSYPGSQSTATRQVLNLQSLIWQRPFASSDLNTFIDLCDSTNIQQILTERQDFLAALQASPVDQIPNGDQLLSALKSAIQDSIQSDESYLDWAIQLCPKPVPVLQSDTDAGNAKEQVVQMWNAQIAGRYPGAEQLSTDQL